MSRLCQDRVVIVTGAARDIGREYALRLAAHGAKVVVDDLGVSREGIGQDLSTTPPASVRSCRNWRGVRGAMRI
jgi:NAD(P)-dependent dehydrogenase (short-subunit alcohol dehydrogenase family)